MKGAWRKTTIGDVITLQRGVDITKTQMEPGNVPVVSSSGISGYHNTAHSKGPGVIIGRKGSLGTAYYVVQDYWPHDTTLWVRDFKGNLPRFVYYFLKSMDFKRLDVGSANPTLNRNHVHPLEVTWPDVETQGAIADILGSLDDKIELNRQMNETLEQMAMALYKHWFVDFGPFQDGEFVESELGPIPKGWNPGSLDDMATTRSEVVQPTETMTEVPYIGLEHMPRGSIALDIWGDSKEVASGKFRYLKGDILFGKLRPYFKKVGVAPNDGICSTDIYVLQPKQPFWFGVVLGQVIQQAFIDHCSNGASGTKMPRTNWGQMCRYRIAIPPDSVGKEFNVLIQTFVHQIRANIDETQTLISIRDYLLPRLLSGEIALQEAEETVEEALAHG